MPKPSSRRTLSDALEIATSALPAAEIRPGQRQMADAVEEAIAEGRHLHVEVDTCEKLVRVYNVALPPSITKSAVRTLRWRR